MRRVLFGSKRWPAYSLLLACLTACEDRPARFAAVIEAEAVGSAAGRDISVRWTLTNRSGRTIRMLATGMPLEPRSYWHIFTVTCDGVPRQYDDGYLIQYPMRQGAPAEIVLKDGESRTQRVSLRVHHKVDTPGEYEVTYNGDLCVIERSGRWVLVPLRSNTVRLHVP